MQAPRLIEGPPLLLAGMSFFGDPFRMSGDWSEENEIGRLWQRFGAYLQAHPDCLELASEAGVSYEVHLQHEATLRTGEVDVFAGLPVTPTALERLPVALLLRRLPACRYAVFTLRGAEITADWPQQIYEQWLPGSGFVEAYPYHAQRYDGRFKGLQDIEHSLIEVYVPIR